MSISEIMAKFWQIFKSVNSESVEETKNRLPIHISLKSKDTMALKRKLPKGKKDGEK